MSVAALFFRPVAGSQPIGQDTHRTLSLVLTTMEIMDYLIMYDHGALNILYLVKGSAEAMPTEQEEKDSWLVCQIVLQKTYFLLVCDFYASYDRGLLEIILFR